MRRFPTFSLLFFGLISFAPLGQAVLTGQAAPDFELTGTGPDIKLKDYRGKVVFLDFWASWCGPCKQSFPWMNEMSQRYKSQGFEVIAISLDKKIEDANKFLRYSPATFDIAFDKDGKTPRLYNIKAMPTSFLIDADGKVILIHEGFRLEDRSALELKVKSELKVK